MKNDRATGALEYVREARRKISEQFDHDPKKLIEHYIELQKKYKKRLLGTEEEEREKAV